MWVVVGGTWGGKVIEEARGSRQRQETRKKKKKKRGGGYTITGEALGVIRFGWLSFQTRGT